MNSDPDLQELKQKLAALDAERAKLIVEINNFRSAEKTHALTTPLPSLLGRPVLSHPPLTPADKISLFLKLFRCREDVFPIGVFRGG